MELLAEAVAPGLFIHPSVTDYGCSYAAPLLLTQGRILPPEAKSPGVVDENLPHRSPIRS